LTDPELIHLARGGDVAAWEMLVARHQEAVFRLAYLLLGDPDDAEDASQETFIRAYRALGRFDESRPLRPWLLRIASNLARNQWRAWGRYGAALQRLARGDLTPDSGPEDEVSQRSRAHMLWKAVRRLSDADQQIIYLRHWLDLSVEETAAVLSVAPGTVKSRLHRAQGRLRGVIEREFPTLAGEGDE
jgi:RNA polymerase sigma-70 factor (ECF subfamily)